MPEKKTIIEDKNFLSDTLSTQVRYIALSVLGIIWGFFVGGTEFTKAIAEEHQKGLVVLFVLSILTLVADYLQYLVGYSYSVELIETMEANGENNIPYDRYHWKYKLRGRLWGIKQWLLGAAVLGLIYTLGSVFFGVVD